MHQRPGETGEPRVRGQAKDDLDHPVVGEGRGIGVEQPVGSHLTSDFDDLASHGIGERLPPDFGGLPGLDVAEVGFVDLGLDLHGLRASEVEESVGGHFADMGMEGEDLAGEGGSDFGLVELLSGAIGGGLGGLQLGAGEGHVDVPHFPAGGEPFGGGQGPVGGGVPTRLIVA